MEKTAKLHLKGLYFGKLFYDFKKSVLKKVFYYKFMNICCLNISSKMHLKLGPARHTRTTPKTLPKP